MRGGLINNVLALFAVLAGASLGPLLADGARGQTISQTISPADEVLIVLSPNNSPSCHGGRIPFLDSFATRQLAMRGHMKGQRLPLTGCEVWSLPRDGLEAFKSTSARSGVVITELGAEWSQLLRPAPPSLRLGKALTERLDLMRAGAATKNVRVMTGPPPAVLEFLLTRSTEVGNPVSEETKATGITLALSDRSVRSITRTSLDIGSDLVVWRGAVDGTGGPVTLMWWSSGKMAGTIQDDDRIYSIRHLDGRIYVIVELAPDRMPREHAPMPGRLRNLDPRLRDDPLSRQGDASLLRRSIGSNDRASRQRTSMLDQRQLPTPARPETTAEGITIDVLVAYTRKSASHYADVRREVIELAVVEANHSFRMSQLDHIKLNLVHAFETGYVERGEHFDHLYRMVDKTDAHMAEIHAFRDKYHADVVMLIVDDAKGCGLATRVYADAADAFAVVHHLCAATTYSLAHEIGHLLGARHELARDPSMFPFPYGHGFVNGHKWRDIMSDKSSCGGCPRLPVWSSPKVLVRGEPAGSADIDNARVIAEQAHRVAAFRCSSEDLRQGLQGCSER